MPWLGSTFAEAPNICHAISLHDDAGKHEHSSNRAQKAQTKTSKTDCLEDFIRSKRWNSPES